MASKTKTKSQVSNQNEFDSVYFLKILLYLILGSVWLAPGSHRVVPVGVIIGIIIARHEKLQLDRKIEYAMLLIGGVLGLVGIGVTITL